MRPSIGPLNTSQKQANYITSSQIFNKTTIGQGIGNYLKKCQISLHSNLLLVKSTYHLCVRINSNYKNDVSLLGQFGEISTAELQHRGSTIKVCINTVKTPSDKEHRKKFFLQQATLAEIMHPNIARYFSILDEGM